MRAVKRTLATHFTPALSAQRPAGQRLVGAVNQRDTQQRQKLWPQGSVTGWGESSAWLAGCQAALTRLCVRHAAEGLVAHGAAQVGTGRRHPDARAGLGAGGAAAALADAQGGHPGR